MPRRKKRGLFGGRFSSYQVGSLFGVDLNISPETKRGIVVIALFTLSALSILGILGLYGDNQFGVIVNQSLGWLFGDLKWLFPVLTAVFGYFLLKSDVYEVTFINYVGAALTVLGLTGLWHARYQVYEITWAANQGLGGGYFGVLLSYPLLQFMGFWGTLIVALAVFLTGILLTFEMSINSLLWPLKLFKYVAVKAKEIYQAVKDKQENIEEEDQDEEYEEEEEEEEIEPEPEIEEEAEVAAPQFSRTQINQQPNPDQAQEMIAKPKKFGRKIELPLSLLTNKSGQPTSGDIKNNQLKIKKTLANFGIEVDMSDVNIGPTVTQYTFRPAEGVKLSKIVGLNNDLSLALAAHPLRIEAPIPGKSLVGIEIPNKMAAKVTMNELLSSKAFKKRESQLAVALGKDVSGHACFGNLEKMPHLLIAGATGSGKSVCINSLIVSLLYQKSPDELKFILVDPKRVELPSYNNIPYLLTPVITDVKKTINALKWTVAEMERRFETLSKVGKRNIEAFNQGNPDKLPYIVFVIDELADLMTTAANDVEGGIVRLAQMARAVGIHLVLATQRPSTDVITGLIKANIPARIAFSVASLIDSRTILDASGAEKLVGRGDMLYLGPEVSKPKRIQGVFLTDEEISNVIGYIKQQGEADYIEGLAEKPTTGPGGHYVDDDADPLLSEAKDIIRESGKASASLLQRRLKIGYARAARILDLLEDQGVIGPADGAKPREVFLDKLQGITSVEFAAKEYGLEGELVPADNLDYTEEEEEDDGATKVVFQTEEPEEETEPTQDLETDQPDQEEEIEVEESEITEDEGQEVETVKKKAAFKEDEWT